jgi:DNA-binding NarL/FixJ family response regulator
MPVHLDQNPVDKSAPLSSEKRRPTIIVAEDNSMMSARLQRLLAVHCELLAAVIDGTALVRAARQHRPEVIVADIDLPEITGLEAARQILADQPRARIVFVTALEDADVIRAAMSIGALGYVVKRDAGKELELAVRSALEGEIYISNVGWQIFGQTFRPRPPWNNDEH